MHPRPAFRTALLVVLLACTTAKAADERSGQAVHRCIGQHGEIVFSGLPCAAGEYPGAAASAAPIATLPADACPTSRDELRDRIAGAVARHDANALAGLLRWRGIGAAAASSRMRALRDLVMWPLLAMEGGGNADEPSTATAAPAADDALRVRTGSNVADGVREQLFGVSVDGSCYWLTW